MADNNTPLDATDRVCVVRRDTNGVGTIGSVTPDMILPGAFTPGAHIADITVTGTYATDDDAIEAAINGILAVLIANGLMAAA